MSGNTKKALTGFEAELFTLDAEGNIVNGADILLAKAKSSGKFEIKKECAHNMIEIASMPGTSV
ncbi:MAG: hypothetical protein V1813_02375, partial [Candidatus Aenigmatarchaeota archaeon]